MKKMLVILALAMFGFANAQKGTILVQGSVGFSSDSNDNLGNENSFNTFNFSPKVGYQFTDNWTLGIEATVAGSKDEDTNFNGFPPFVTFTRSTEKNTVVAVGPFARYTRPISELFSVYADLGLGFQSAKVTNENFNSVSGVTTSTSFKGNGFYAALTPAIFINIKKSFGLNVGIGGLRYGTLSYDAPGGDNSQFEITFGQTFNIGISKNF